VGQNGTVVKALHLPTLRIVALKVALVFDTEERHQLVKELKSFTRCNSPYILSFLGACFSEGRITMALEFMNRGSLDQVVKRQGPLAIPAIRSITRQVMRGLKHLQQRKCIHRSDTRQAELTGRFEQQPQSQLSHSSLAQPLCPLPRFLSLNQ